MPLDFESARELFPALREKVFLDAACVSLAPRPAIEAVEEFLRLTLHCPARSSTLHHLQMDGLRSQARLQVARLIHAREQEIALVESTTHGLAIAAEAIPLERGDRVLLCDLEFLQVALPWRQKRETAGIEIDVVTNRGGAIRTDDIAAKITPRTEVVAISSVQWSNGFRCDLGALSALCRERNVWLVVDAIQQLGAIPIDVGETPVDFLACGGHKWLNSPFGAGFLYVSANALPRLRPSLAGYLSLENPAGGWGNYFQTPSIQPVVEPRWVSEARRYEIGGTSNYPGAIALGASLQLLYELGQDRIAARVFELTDHLFAGLKSLRVAIVTPREREHRSGIVTFSIGSAAENVALMEHLLDHKVLVSVRYTSQVGGVRVSCHYFNSFADLDRLLNLVEAFVRKH